MSLISRYSASVESYRVPLGAGAALSPIGPESPLTSRATQVDGGMVIGSASKTAWKATFVVFIWVKQATVPAPPFLWVWADVVPMSGSEAAVAHLGDWAERSASKFYALKVHVAGNSPALEGVEACSVRSEGSGLDYVDIMG